MFCSKCRSEYKKGFTECPDCKVPLVSELPPNPKPKYVDFEEVLSTFNPADIAIIKSILDTEELTYFFQGEHFNYVRPLAIPARLMVRKDQVQRAKNLLKDLKIRYMAISLDKNPKENKDS
jgi:hypothetical protein